MAFIPRGALSKKSEFLPNPAEHLVWAASSIYPRPSMNTHQKLIEAALQWAESDCHDSRLGKLGVQRATEPTELQPMLYEPIVALVLQGRKRTMIGGQTLEYGAGECFVGAIAVPALWQIIQASPSEPFVAVSLFIDPAKLQSMLIETEPQDLAALTAGFGVTSVQDELVDAFARMLRLFHRPEDVAILEPLLEREILFRLLQGTRGAILRQLAGSDSRLSYVRKALTWMKSNFAVPVHIDDLASMAGMSVSVFHRHFKAVTAMTPIQYQKQLRLHEARRRLLEESEDATGVAFSVGYESLSQFSREYSRLFGAPPIRDIRRLRRQQLSGLSVAVRRP